MSANQLNFFQVSIPDEFLPVVNDLKIGKNVDDKVRVSLAIGLFVGKQVTLARAAELAGKSLADFIDVLRSYQIPWMDYTEKHLMEDESTIQELLNEKEVSDGSDGQK